MSLTWLDMVSTRLGPLKEAAWWISPLASIAGVGVAAAWKWHAGRRRDRRACAWKLKPELERIVTHPYSAARRPLPRDAAGDFERQLGWHDRQRWRDLVQQHQQACNDTRTNALGEPIVRDETRVAATAQALLAMVDIAVR